MHAACDFDGFEAKFGGESRNSTKKRMLMALRPNLELKIPKINKILEIFIFHVARGPFLHGPGTDYVHAVFPILGDTIGNPKASRSLLLRDRLILK